MTPPIDIRPHDLQEVRTILATHLPAGSQVWVFGSRAKFTAHRGSDLDLAIDAGRPLTTTESIELADAFDESNLPYTVDVVDFRSITPHFRAIIEQQPMVAIAFGTEQPADGTPHRHAPME